MNGLKLCRVCDRELPAWRFDYWRAQCKLCYAELRRLRYAAKKEGRNVAPGR
mgnify:CR=1 FL=1